MNNSIEKHVRDYSAELGIDSSKVELMIQYVKELLEENKKVNLTSIRDYETALSVHLEDSLYGYRFIANAPEGRYGDLGSGCGVPGALIGIATGRETVLVDSTGKKMSAVSAILKRLDVSDHISTNTTRIEDLAKVEPESFDVLSARALDKLSIVMELASPLLKMGGHLVQFKGDPNIEELNHANEVAEIVGMKEIERYTCKLQHDDMKRTIVVYEKVAEPTIALPRRNGVAQKKPL